ncbi:MAG: NUDIX hydrolase [Patescibacteria group bacterium]
MKPQIQFITAKGILRREGRILCLKDTSGNWELPGGRLDFGETPELALKREFKEELQAQDVQVGRLLHAWTFMVSGEDSDRQYVLLVYECEAPQQELRRSDEHLEIGWFTKGEIVDLPMRDGYKQAINKL